MAFELRDPNEGRLAGWLLDTLGENLIRVRPLSGGRSNETYALDTDVGVRVLRRPPGATIDASAHSMKREYLILSALAQTDVPAPQPLAYCADDEILGAPFLVMDFASGFAPLDELPESYAGNVGGVGEAIIDALASVHSAPWREIGLRELGKPEGFLARQVPRWTKQYDGYRVRALPRFDQVSKWLETHRPADGAPALLHGDFHADNCLLGLDAPRVTAIIDWEMATIGDPLLDLGLLLAFWGNDRPVPPAMGWVQEFSRVPSAPSRDELAARYAEKTGRSVAELPYYLALAFWKLAAIVEGAYANYLSGQVDDEYSKGLAAEVPRLLEEAAGFSSIN